MCISYTPIILACPLAPQNLAIKPAQEGPVLVDMFNMMLCLDSFLVEQVGIFQHLCMMDNFMGQFLLPVVMRTNIRQLGVDSRSCGTKKVSLFFLVNHLLSMFRSGDSSCCSNVIAWWRWWRCSVGISLILVDGCHCCTIIRLKTD